MLLTAMACQFNRLLRILLVILFTAVLLSTYLLDPPATPTNDVTARDRSIEAVERHCLVFDVGGRMFDEGGRGAEIHGTVTSCLVHSFSPQVEREAARRFLDPARDNIYFANSPAITWFGDQLVLVSRIWLDRERLVWSMCNAAFTPDTCSPDSSCIHLYPLSPSTSYIGDKIVVTATCIYSYPQWRREEGARGGACASGGTFKGAAFQGQQKNWS